MTTLGKIFSSSLELGTYIRGISIRNICNRGTCSGGTYTRAAGTNSTYTKSACTAVVSDKRFYVKSVYAIDCSEKHSQSFQILKVEGAR